MIMIVMFVGGLIIYRRALLLVQGLSSGQVHIVLLGFVLTPAAGLLAGMLNYDNLAFLLFGYMLYIALKLMNHGEIQPQLVLKFIIISGVLVLVKWSAIALCVPLFVAVFWQQFSNFGLGYISMLITKFRKLSNIIRYALLIGLAITTFLVIERPIQNLLVYGRADPRCETVLSHDRCMNYQDYAAYQETLDRKDQDFKPYSLPIYIARYWVPHMADKSANLIERSGDSRLDIVAAFYLIAAITSLTVLIFGHRKLFANKSFRILTVVVISYIIILVVQEYIIYNRYGIPGAIRTRYLVPILPIYGGMLLYVVWPYLRRFRKMAAIFGIVTLLVLTQGGSIITHLFTAPKNSYSSDTGYDINSKFKSLIDPIIYNE